jgi:hypothetical protein
MFSLKLFFNRKGWVVKGLLIVGWVLILLQTLKLPTEWDSRGGLTSICFLMFVILGAFITILRFIPWYSGDSRGLGIEEHFEKNLVPIAYLLPIAFGLLRFFDSPWGFFIFVDFFFLVVLAVNATLIYYHFIDTDSAPVSLFINQP